MNAVSTPNDHPAEPGSVRIEREAVITDPEQVGPHVDIIRSQALPFLERGYRIVEDMTVTDHGPADDPTARRVTVSVVLHPTKGYRPILDRWRPTP